MESDFSMKLLIFLGAAIVMVPLVRKIGLSSVIGYILGGVIIGPFVLKLTGNDTHDVMNASEFGVVMLLFIVGLELEPKKFWAMRKKIIGLGLSQMSITVVLLYVILTLARWPTDQAVVIALSFALSSTAIVLQTLQEKKMFRTTAGQSSFSTLLFQDIAVIPILALIPLIAQSDDVSTRSGGLKSLLDDNSEWIQASTVVLGILLLYVLGNYVFVPFLRYVSKSGMPELLTATSLFLVVGVSELMEFVGLSPALGAFLAGVMLANSEFKHELEAHIDPFKGLLLAVFFVSVGSTINFVTIQQHPILIFSLAFAVLSVKFIVLFFVGKFYKLEKGQNFFYAFALSQVGEFAFVLISFSNKLFLFNDEVTSQLMAVTAITMFSTPILMILHEKIILKKINSKIEIDTPYDIMNKNIAQKKIIIVGFGSFGSIVGRLLKANKVSATILDNDSERVKLLRSFGFKVYYGDATKIPTLRAAGIAEAEILVLCLDNPEENKLIAELVRQQFPNVKIYVRAKTRHDAYYYLNHGIENSYRENLGTAVSMAVDLLHETGMRKYAARRLGKRFMSIDKISLKRLAKKLEEKEISTFNIKENIIEEEALLSEDSLTFENHDWMETEVEEEKNEEEVAETLANKPE
ncbi:MAG: potassium transporter [Bergeyella sp.]|nr:potassium transporter [Bergeyella sp.]